MPPRSKNISFLKEDIILNNFSKKYVYIQYPTFNQKNVHAKRQQHEYEKKEKETKKKINTQKTVLLSLAH